MDRALWLHRKLAVGLAAAVALLLGATLPAAAHSYLKETIPAKKERLKQPPKEVVLRFGGAIEPKYSSASLEDEAGKPVATQSAVTGERELTLNGIPASLPAGRYRVKYKVLSGDGHTVEGRFEFFIGSP